MFDIPVDVKVILGKKTLRIKDLLKLGRGAVLPLDRYVNEDVELFANNKLVAKGQVITDGNKLMIEITDVF
jgi:flagellar motor switch protein FliN/FliY